MSNIYIQEPPTSGKVLLKTTVGDIDIELWSKETSKACRNFIQLCMEDYYNGTVFHRVIKNFIAQGGDPTGTGMGGESIYGQPFKDEFHSRLRFVRRGLVAMASSGPNDNGSQFFFTLGGCPELQNKHTIFGKVTGKTLYNMLKLEESLVDGNDRPLYPHKIIETKVLSNPFNDIIPREKKKKTVEVEEKQIKLKPTKNFNLLSFGEEAEEEEAEVDLVAQEYRGKSKSSHDLANDPHLSSVPAIPNEDSNDSTEIDSNLDGENQNKDQLDVINNIRKKLTKDPDKTPDTNNTDRKYDDDEEEKDDKRKEIRREISKLKREIRGENKKIEEEEVTENKKMRMETNNELLEDFHKQIEKYAEMKKNMPKRDEREEKTLALLAKFQNKLQSARQEMETKQVPENAVDEEDNNKDDDEGWLTHQLHFEDSGLVFAKDANMKTEDTFEIFDPRNPINQRRREASKQAMKKRH